MTAAPDESLLVLLAPAVVVVASSRFRGGHFWRGLGLLGTSLAAGTLFGGAVGGATLTPPTGSTRSVLKPNRFDLRYVQ